MCQLHPRGIIQRENFNSGAPGGRQPINVCFPEREVIKLLVAPGMKEDLHRAGQWIDPTEVGALAEVAAMACQSKIVDIIGPPVLPGNHMLSMMHEFAIVLMKPAVLASLSSPTTN